MTTRDYLIKVSFSYQQELLQLLHSNEVYQDEHQDTIKLIESNYISILSLLKLENLNATFSLEQVMTDFQILVPK